MSDPKAGLFNRFTTIYDVFKKVVEEDAENCLFRSLSQGLI